MAQHTKYERLSRGSDGDGDGDGDSTICTDSSLQDDLFLHLKSRRGLSTFWLTAVVFAFLTIILLTGTACFQWGRHIQKLQYESDWFSPPGTVEQTFHYQRQFALRPSNESSQKWTSLFPRGRGFVKHPVISPVPMGISVYHQLHCLDAIRRGYWGAVDGIKPDHHSAPGHVRHCIDYLRQSLMCHADTNLEPIVMDLHGTTGWDFTRKCRDYSQLLAWADEWRTHDQTSIT